jgi:hypothetical protein
MQHKHLIQAGLACPAYRLLPVCLSGVCSCARPMAGPAARPSSILPDNQRTSSKDTHTWLLAKQPVVLLLTQPIHLLDGPLSGAGCSWTTKGANKHTPPCGICKIDVAGAGSGLVPCLLVEPWYCVR